MPILFYQTLHLFGIVPFPLLDNYDHLLDFLNASYANATQAYVPHNSR